MKCSIKFCDRPHKARTYCSLHYQRWSKRGNPEILLQAPNGSGCLVKSGYIMLTKKKRRVFQHVLNAEVALGKRLPIGAIVHHINGIRNDNRNSNLIICQNEKYHRLLHIRQRAFDETGNADYRLCVICKKHDDVNKMTQGKKRMDIFKHPRCSTEYSRKYRASHATS